MFKLKTSTLSSDIHNMSVWRLILFRAARFSPYPGNLSCLPPSFFFSASLSSVQLGDLEKKEGGPVGGGRSLCPVFWLVGSDVSGATSWSVCSLGGGEGDCGVVSLNKMAAIPLSTRAHWTPTMSVRSAVWINTECISRESLLSLHSR